MALDQQSAAMLEAMASLAPRPIEQLSVAEARAFESSFPVTGSGPVAAVDDLHAALPDRTLRIRLYRPSDARLPVVVYFHGGGWTLSGVESYDAVCRQLANRSGCAIASVDYRLAPEHKFPAAFHDGTAAVSWLAAHGDALGLDVSHIAVAGDSAGGNLATSVALRDSSAARPLISFQALIYPVTEYEFARPSMRADWSGYPLSSETVKWFWAHYLSTEADASNPAAAPMVAADLSGMPAALVITAEDDPVRDQGEAYAWRLSTEGVPVRLSRYPGVFHGFFPMLGAIDKAAKAVDEVASALRDALTGTDAETAPAPSNTDR
jgi:acetyl esterase